MHSVIVDVLKRSYAGFSNAGAAQLESNSETPFDEMKHINFRGGAVRPATRASGPDRRRCRQL
jgi:hypothetical protein